jgi:hypothetical protein
MAELTVTTDTTNPDELYADYQDFVARYQRVQADIEFVDLRLGRSDDLAERDHLEAELSALSDDATILCGWLSAAFAAYVFTRYGTHTDRVHGSGSTTITVPGRR